MFWKFGWLKVIAFASIFILTVISGLAFSYWKFVYLPQIIPVVPVPYGAKLIDHRDWATSEVDWYRDTYEVDAMPEDIENFYRGLRLQCTQYSRGFVNKEGFLMGCWGNAKPIGWYHLEIGKADSDSKTIIVVEVGWEAGP